MKTLLNLALGAVTLAAIVLAGCSQNDLSLAPTVALRGLSSQPARPDTTPKPHPTPPPDTTIVPVQFAGSDSTQAGQTGISRWLVGNPSRGPFLVQWVLTESQGWPGFPIQGSLRVRGRSLQPLDVPIPVPTTATTGIYSLLMTVTTLDGGTASAEGSIRVFGNDPPPPPPPPLPAVRFAGSDSVHAGETATTMWELGNESDHPFTMSWTMRGPNWPSLPRQGSESLQPQERRLIQVQVAVPDTAGPGQHFIEMEVTRPDSLPPASAPGWINVLP